MARNSSASSVIDREDAIRLLFEKNDSNSNERITTVEIFDQNGNYTYPTEATVSKPNIAYGALGKYDIEQQLF